MRILAIFIGGVTSVNADVFLGQTVAIVYSGYSHKSVFFKVSIGDSRNPSECTTGFGQIFVVDPDFSDIGQALSILLFAQVTSKQVEVEFYADKCFENHRVM